MTRYSRIVVGAWAFVTLVLAPLSIGTVGQMVEGHAAAYRPVPQMASVCPVAVKQP